MISITEGYAHGRTVAGLTLRLSYPTTGRTAWINSFTVVATPSDCHEDDLRRWAAGYFKHAYGHNLSEDEMYRLTIEEYGRYGSIRDIPCYERVYLADEDIFEEYVSQGYIERRGYMDLAYFRNHPFECTVYDAQCTAAYVGAIR